MDLTAQQKATESLIFVSSRKGLRAAVSSVEDAASKWVDYRMRCILAGSGGVSEIGNGGKVMRGRAVVARISYNGRIWTDAVGV